MFEKHWFWCKSGLAEDLYTLTVAYLHQGRMKSQLMSEPLAGTRE